MGEQKELVKATVRTTRRARCNRFTAGGLIRVVLPIGRRLEGLRESKVRELCQREWIPTTLNQG